MSSFMERHKFYADGITRVTDPFWKLTCKSAANYLCRVFVFLNVRGADRSKIPVCWATRPKKK